MQKENEVMSYLESNIFNPILDSKKASESLKKGIRFTIMRLKERDAKGMVHYYWSAIVGTDNSTKFAKQMKEEGFTRFEEVMDEFRERFSDAWLRG